jgi:tRNA A37 threonylcarbamoyladenosine dehydratase
MIHPFSRTERLVGKEAMNQLYNSKVAVFGIGGVGSYVVEGLVRSGIGHLVLVDNDTVCLTNLNRQILATVDTIGQPKVEVMKQRIRSINPNVKVEIYQTFFLPDTADQVTLDDCDYIVDAIDTVTGKIEIIQQAKAKGIPVISSLGTGNKLDPTKLEVDDIYNTSICPLAKVMRKELKKREIDHLKVVYSKETPIKPKINEGTETKSSGRPAPGSISFVPSVAGLIIAGEVIKDLIIY